ncbi:MAG: MBOAT family O-acyltransferase [Oscillospiraceae bacterium]
MTFLWLFLPLVLILSRLIPGIRIKNALLLVASLIFYAWGEPYYILLMIASIVANWLFGLLIDSQQSAGRRKTSLVLALVFNLSMLGYYKYYDMAVRALNALTSASITVRDIALPIGISFYTFQILSYIIDLYRREIDVQKNPFRLGLYISFFAQLIAGPIVNYKDIENQLTVRATSVEKTAYGIKRFIYGLGKKVLISNQLALAADGLFAIDYNLIPTAYMWLAALLYSFQIYFDFSGYSDMAIGLGKMFGFDFLENFNYPYLAQSVTEFWRRWHISLTRWFRSYLYIPLGGNRKGTMRTVINIGVVFALTGLWHGAAWSFVFWGVWHGFFMILERLFLSKWLERCPYKIINRIYSMLVVLIGWVFFRAGSLSGGMRAVLAMLGRTEGRALPIQMFMSGGVWVALVAAILLCGPIQQLVPKLKAALYDEHRTGYLQTTVLAVILCASILFLVSGAYNPFIYFRF